MGKVAETKGFEPSRRFPAYSLSRGAPSTTRPRLRRPVYQRGGLENKGKTIGGRKKHIADATGPDQARSTDVALHQALEGLGGQPIDQRCQPRDTPDGDEVAPLVQTLEDFSRRVFG